MAYGKTKADHSGYLKLKKDLSEDQLGNLYLFHGEEVYLRDFYLEQMKKKLLPQGMEDFNLHSLEGRSFDLKVLAQLVDCLPMMGSRTMVIVTDYDIYKGDRDGMATLLADLPEYVCLIFVYDLIEYKSDARTKIASMLKAKSAVVNFARQEQGDLSDWVRRRFKAMDRDIAAEDAKYLIFLCGDLMNGLICEIGKIGSYAKEHRVTRADIDAVATPQLDAVVFQMTDAISAGNYDRAAAVLGDLLHMQEPPIKIFYSLGKQLRGLYAARLALDAHKTADTVMEICGLNSSWQADRLLQSARRFSLEECRRAVVRCGELDYAMKSGGGDAEDLLVNFLLALAGGREHAQN